MNIQEIIKKVANGETIEATRGELEALGKWRIETHLDTNEDAEDPDVIWGSEYHTLYCDDVVVAEWEIEGCSFYGANGRPESEWGVDATNYHNNADDFTKSLLATLGIDDPMMAIPEPPDYLGIVQQDLEQDRDVSVGRDILLRLGEWRVEQEGEATYTRQTDEDGDEYIIAEAGYALYCDDERIASWRHGSKGWRDVDGEWNVKEKTPETGASSVQVFNLLEKVGLVKYPDRPEPHPDIPDPSN